MQNPICNSLLHTIRVKHKDNQRVSNKRTKGILNRLTKTIVRVLTAFDQCITNDVFSCPTAQEKDCRKSFLQTSKIFQKLERADEIF